MLPDDGRYRREHCALNAFADNERNRNRRDKGYISGVYVTGPRPRMMLDVGWPLVKDHVSDTMVLSVIMGGPAPWTGTVVTMADSADAIIEGGPILVGPKMQEFMANNGSQQ